MEKHQNDPAQDRKTKSSIVDKQKSNMVQTGERKIEDENNKAAVAGKRDVRKEDNEQDEDNL